MLPFTFCCCSTVCNFSDFFSLITINTAYSWDPRKQLCQTQTTNVSSCPSCSLLTLKSDLWNHVSPAPQSFQLWTPYYFPKIAQEIPMQPVKQMRSAPTPSAQKGASRLQREGPRHSEWCKSLYPTLPAMGLGQTATVPRPSCLSQFSAIKQGVWIHEAAENQKVSGTY